MLVAGALLTASTMTSNAAVVSKSPSEVKIYINPGHGGFNGGCRPMGTVKRGENVTTATTADDTTAFFESNTNLWKCLAMYHKLVDYGVPEYGSNALFDATNYKNQHLVMSRITNGTDEDRPTVAANVEQFSPDIFIAVHSNASPDESIGGNENYPLVIYRGEDYRSTAFTDTGYGQNWDYSGTGLTGAGDSYEFSKLVYSHLATIEHEPYTSEWKDQYVSGYTPLKTEHNVRGDVNLQDYFNLLKTGSFTLNGNRGSGTTNSYSGKKYYGFYGVMKHGAVGCLSEGYMHTYYPSVNRHMNKDVCAIEGISYAHAIADYFGWEKEKVGYIYGIVRDRNQTFTHTYYIPNQSTDDIYKPLDSCTVKLYKDGVLVDTYVTDDECNGAFVFYDLEPGDYTLDYECKGYQAASQGLKSTIVTVKANEISYPKAFLNAEGYSTSTDYEFALKSDISDWYVSFADHTSYPGSIYLQAAVSNDVFYTVPAPLEASDMFNSSDNYCTKGWLIKSGTLSTFSGGSGSFYGSSGTYYYAGPAITADADGTIWTAAARSIYGPSAYPWSNPISRLIYWKSDGVPTGSTAGGTKNAFTLSTAISKRSDLMTSYGNCLTGEGSLWFCLFNTNSIERVIVKDGAYSETIAYTTPSAITTQNSRCTAYQYAENKVCYAPGVNSPSATNYQSIYKGIINGSTITWTDLGVKSYGPCATMFELYGHEILAYSSSTTNVTIRDITAGKDIATITPWSSASTNGYVQHSLNSKVNGDGTAYLYVYVPGRGAARYSILTSAIPNDSMLDPVAVTGAVGSTEAEVVANNYEPSITVTWEAPDSWTQQPTNYLVQYRMYYTQADGTKQYMNFDSSGNTIYTDSWYTAGMTEDATCAFVHEDVEFASSSTAKEVYPMTYEYRIIPNFNCYDGEVSEISSTVTIDFVAPKPEWSSFTIEPVIEDNELKQYDATAIWYGVDFESNKEFSLQGYKLELFRSEDTEKTNPVASFSFKVSGLGELTDNVGAVLDDNGNAIENLTYSKVVNPNTGATVNQFSYNAYDLDVLDVNADGTTEGKEFTAQVTAEFWISDSEFAYGVDNIPVTCENAYTPIAPSVKQPVVKYYEDLQWGDWDADYYGNPAKGEYDKDDAYWKVYWVNMDITKPNAEVPVSSYTLTLASKGKSDVAEVMLYDPNESLGLPVITEGYATGYVALPVNVAAETYSARSTVEATSATFTIPGNYDFSQAEAANVPMVTFYVKDFTPMGGATNDTDGDNSALNYTYTVAANYASGNSAISSTATGGANPVDGGITTAVEGIEVAGVVNNVVVYPVPATISVTVKASEAIEQVAIYSAAGAIVKSLQGDGECAMTIAVDDLEVGTYFVRVNNFAPVKIVKN